MTDIEDFETWLIDVGDVIILKESTEGTASLSSIESAIYDLWAVDYAVRNAGDMRALKELRPKAAKNLAAYLYKIGSKELSESITKLAKSGADCDSYYDIFEQLCINLSNEQART